MDKNLSELSPRERFILSFTMIENSYLKFSWIRFYANFKFREETTGEIRKLSNMYCHVGLFIMLATLIVWISQQLHCHVYVSLWLGDILQMDENVFILHIYCWPSVLSSPKSTTVVLTFCIDQPS